MADATRDQDGFSDSYLRELGALHREGAEFAGRYPKVAARLRIGDRESPDPHVERLIESVAFLTARVQRKLEDEIPELSDALLEVLYPHLLRPIPSMAVVEMALDLDQNVPLTGRRIERGTRFMSKAVRGAQLEFRSTATATLWPLRIIEVGIDPVDGLTLERYPDARAILKMRIESVGEADFSKLRIEHLSFFLHGESRTVYALYDALVADALDVTVRDGGGRSRGWSVSLGEDAIEPMGFGPDEAMLPYPRRSFSGYRLIQEYFAFPAKFHFLKLRGLDRIRAEARSEIEIRIALRNDPAVPHEDISAANFSLSAVPLVNLFERTADPILLSPFISEHLIVPDAQRPLDLEVYSVESVRGLSAGTPSDRVYSPFFSVRHDAAPDEERAYWHVIRRASRRKGDDGTEASMALVDLDLERAFPGDDTLHVSLVCSNRDMPAQITSWGRNDDFAATNAPGIKGIRCLHRPSAARRPQLGGAAHWRLLSQLSLNYLSLVREGRDALCEILRVHDVARSASNRDEIEGITETRSKPVVRWIQGEFGGGFCRGTRTTLVLDRRRFLGGSPLLLSAVLDRFLALYCEINSFSELCVELVGDEGVFYSWKPRAGERTLL